MVIDDSVFARALADAVHSFADGELAYLALTSMVERPLLDRLAFRLHKELAQQGYVVAREWPIPKAGSRIRADLAVLVEGAPVTLLEGKATSSYAPTLRGGTNVRFATRMQADLDRLADAELPGADIYCLLLGAHPHRMVPDHLASTVKYAKRINAAFAALGTQEELANFAFKRVRKATVQSALRDSGLIHGGSAFGIPVDLLWWIFGPFQSPANLRIASASPKKNRI